MTYDILNDMHKHQNRATMLQEREVTTLNKMPVQLIVLQNYITLGFSSDGIVHVFGAVNDTNGNLTNVGDYVRVNKNRVRCLYSPPPPPPPPTPHTLHYTLCKLQVDFKYGELVGSECELLDHQESSFCIIHKLE